MTWKILIHKKVVKQLKQLDDDVIAVFRLLVSGLEVNGPAPGVGWRNYGKLKLGKGRDLRHCHLTSGKPTYVCCWEVVDKKIQILEIYYVGTHEKAPY